MAEELTELEVYKRMYEHLDAAIVTALEQLGHTPYDILIPKLGFSRLEARDILLRWKDPSWTSWTSQLIPDTQTDI